MTDPGSFTAEEQKKEKDIDVILFTHEHGDHYHLESLKEILKNSPNAKIITNAGVGKLLDEAGIKYEIMPDKTSKEVLSGIELEAHDCKHGEIFEEYGQVPNTGFFIGKRLFYPGDSYYNPGKPVEILALPVAGPWAKVADFMRYALDVKPKVCCPVHDGMLGKYSGLAYWVPEKVLPENGISFKILEKGKTEEF